MRSSRRSSFLAAAVIPAACVSALHCSSSPPSAHAVASGVDSGQLYEAELATLLGPTQIFDCPACSGGKRVGVMGTNGGAEGAVDFTVHAAAESDFDVAVAYTWGRSDTRSFELRVDGGSVVSVAVTPTGSFDTPGVSHVTVHLGAGDHDLRLGNSINGTADLDCIVLTPSDPRPVAEAGAPPGVEGGAPPAESGSGPVAAGGPLPIEVIGDNGYVRSVAFTAQAQGASALWIQVNNLSYENKGSVQVNGCNWVDLNKGTVTFEGNAAYYGGFNTVINTTRLTVPTTCGVDGLNTISFRFNQDDGISIGYRVIALDLRAPDGTSLVPAGTLAMDDPSTWTPPLPGAADIAAGQQLFQSATLSKNRGGPPILAHCADCHASQATDLAYFNFSNWSIVQRSIFHGLTEQQGEQIASYVRSNPGPKPGRPWNPPFQPGPGRDSVPPEQLSAGAGIDQVFEFGTDALNQLPGGVSAATFNSARASYPHYKEWPVELALEDWNHWLPIIHPMDAWAGWANGNALPQLATMKAAAAANGHDYVVTGSFESDIGSLGNENDPLWSTMLADTDNADPNAQYRWYSWLLWRLTQVWALVRENDLEQYCPEANAAQALPSHDPTLDVEPRCFMSGDNRLLFSVAAHLGHLGDPTNETAEIFHDDSHAMWAIQSAIWYQAQVLVNDGSRRFGGTSPIDWNYLDMFLHGASYEGVLGDNSSPHNTPALALQGWVSALWNTNTGFGVGPDTNGTGFSYRANAPDNLGDSVNWDLVDPAVRASTLNAYLEAWLDVAELYDDVPRGTTCEGKADILGSPNQTVDNCDQGPVQSANRWIPQFQAWGVDQALVNRWVQRMVSWFPVSGLGQYKK